MRTGSQAWVHKTRIVQVCPFATSVDESRLLPRAKGETRVSEEREQMQARSAGVMAHAEKRICKHTSYPRGSSSRVAVNPGTLILMRLRHVPGRIASRLAAPRRRSFTSQKAGEFGGVYNAKCIQNLGLFTIPRHHPLARFPSACLSLVPCLSPSPRSSLSLRTLYHSV